MKMSQMFPANFLKKEDVPQPTRAVIARVTMEEVTGDTGKEMKATIHFEGDELKPMILNKGNATTISETFGDDSDNWIGKTIEIFTDAGVMFGGKRVGGLRVRVPSQTPTRPAPNANGPLWDFSDRTPAHTRSGQTTEQVVDYITALMESGGPMPVIRVRRSGTMEVPIPADQWLAQHGAAAPAGADDSFIPF